MGDMFRRVSARNRDGSVTRVLTNSAAHGIVDQSDYFDKDIANQDNVGGYYVVEDGDFVYNPRTSTLAPVGPMKRNHVGTGVMSPLYSVFRPTGPEARFYEHYFETALWHDYLRSVGNQGARHDRMAVSIADMMLMPLPLPPEDERDRVTEACDALADRVRLADDRISVMRSFKHGLLQQMFA